MNDHGARVYDSILGLLSSEENPTEINSASRLSYIADSAAII